MFTPETYSDRPGAKDYGREYEVQVGSLLFLRSIKKKDTKHTWLAMNVDECGAFDDILLYRQTQDNNGITYLIQLKYQTKEQTLRRRDFINARKDDFLLKKYSSSIIEIKNRIDKSDKNKCDILSHLTRNQDNIVFIIFTNRGTTQGDFLKQIDKSSEKDQKWCLYDVVDTNGNIWQFNYEQLEFLVEQDITNYMDEVFLLTKQIRVRNLNNSLENIIKSFVGSLECDNRFMAEIVKDFVWFIIDWSKGHLGGYYPLTKEKVFKVLLDLMLAPYVVKTQQPRSNTNYNCDIWNRITTDKNLIIVDCENQFQICIEFLQQCISNDVMKYCEEVTNKKLWLNNPETVSKQMLRVISRCKKIRPSDAYEYLWKTEKIPLVIKVETLKDYKNVLAILRTFIGTLRVIIINKSGESLNNFNYGTLKIFANFNQLSVEEQKQILPLPIKVQKRQSILQNVLTKTMYEHVKVSHVIAILCNSFNIGDSYNDLPDNFVERSLTKVWLNGRVLQDVTDDYFLIRCDSMYDFKMFLKKNSIRLATYNICHRKSDSASLNNSRINIFDHNVELVETAEVKNGTFHYLVLHGQSDLEWVRSYSDAKNIIKYKIESDLIDFINIKQISDTLSKSKLPLLYLISAQSGMGKTTLMDYIFQHAPVNFWVLRINLLDFIDYYQSNEFKLSNNLEYFAQKILLKHKSKTDLTWAVFKHYLEKKQVIVLFDGFDEVPLALQEHVKDMIKNIWKLQFTLFVTTRPVLKSQLEEILQTFALSLKTFTRDDQFRFLTNYFAEIDDEATSNIADRQNLIHTYVTCLLNAAKMNLKDQDQDFTGIPLQTKLLAEVFTEDYKTFLQTKIFVREHFDFMYLYRHFIDQKLKIACIKFGNTSNDMINLYKNHASLYALQLLFTKNDLEKLNIDYLLQHLIKLIPNLLHIIQRDGIVVVNDENIVTFAHRTFAEYLAAEWLYNNINNDEYSSAIKILVNKIFNSSFGIVRNVFDRFLAKNSQLNLAVISQNSRTVGEMLKISDLYQTDEGGRTFLHVMAAWGVHHPDVKSTIPNEPLVELIQTISDDVINNLMKKRDLVLGYTPLDYALLSGALCIANELCVPLVDMTGYITDNANIDLNYMYKICYRHYYGFLCASILRHSMLHDINGSCSEVHNELGVEEVIGRTPLHQAVITKNKEKVVGLLTQNIDLDVKDNKKKSALFYAATLLDNNDYDIVLALLDKGADTNVKGYYNQSLLHYCIFYNQMYVLEMLLEKGANINAIDVFGRTPLHWAAIAGKTNFVALLLAKGANITVTDKMHLTAMHCSAKNFNVDITKLLIDKMGNLNVKDANGNTPLHKAASNGHCSILELLLSKGADIEAKNGKGSTALHCAVLNNRIQIINCLITNGANIEAKTANNITALFLATCSGNTEIISLLLDHKADIETKSASLKTPLHLAAVRNDSETLSLLLSRGANIEAKSKYGNTPLNFAVKNNNIDAIKTLLSYGADIEAKPSFNETPLHFATKRNFIEIVDILLKNCASTAARNYDTQTPLHLAVEHNHVKIVTLLLENGADVNAKFDNGKSALHVASSKNYVDLVWTLSKNGANIEDEDEQNMTALHWAVYKNNIQVIELLLTLGANMEARDDTGMTLLHWTVYKGKTHLLKLLISKGINLEIRDFRGLTPLHWAALKGYSDCANILVESGAFIEARDYNNKTPLLWATYNYSPDTIRLLLSKGVDVDTVDSEYGRTALITSTISGFTTIVQLLITSKASVSERDNLGKTALLYAVLNGHKDIIKLLLENGSCIEEQDPAFGRSPLIWAAYKGQIHCLKLLLKQGADRNARDVDGVTALEWAARKGYKRCTLALCDTEES